MPKKQGGGENGVWQRQRGDSQLGLTGSLCQDRVRSTRDLLEEMPVKDKKRGSRTVQGDYVSALTSMGRERTRRRLGKKGLTFHWGSESLGQSTGELWYRDFP